MDDAVICTFCDRQILVSQASTFELVKGKLERVTVPNGRPWAQVICICGDCIGVLTGDDGFAQAGMAWWNAMTEIERREAIAPVGKRASVADAYRFYLERNRNGGGKQETQGMAGVRCVSKTTGNGSQGAS